MDESLSHRVASNLTRTRQVSCGTPTVSTLEQCGVCLLSSPFQSVFTTSSVGDTITWQPSGQRQRQAGGWHARDLEKESPWVVRFREDC